MKTTNGAMRHPIQSQTRRRRPRILPALLRRPAAARFLSMSEASLDRLVAGGLCPAPRKINGMVLFGRRELSDWVDSGCPTRLEWEAMKNTRGRRRA